MAYQKFSRTRAAIGEAMVSVTKYGQLNLNNACYEKFIKANRAEYVELYFDPERRAIGIKPIKEKSAHSYHVRLDNAAKSASVSAIAFLKYYKIDYSETKTFQANWSSKEHLIEICLS